MPLKDRKMARFVWNMYNKDRLRNSSCFTDHTTGFFNHIPSEIKHTFTLSSNKIVQFGAGAGNFISRLRSERQIVGYEYSSVGVTALEKSGITTRNIDLDETTSSTLAYQHVLTNDLDSPTDILIIRTLECLTPEAGTLLLFTLIAQAKPGSTFYIEHAESTDESMNKLLTDTGQRTNLPSGFLASFFAPRTDFRFILHQESKSIEINEAMQVTQLIIQKI